MRFGVADLTRVTCGDRTCFPAQSSVLDEQAISLRILPEYELPKPIGCRFLTRGDSDIYQVETEAGLYYLKIRRPPISRERCDAEARLIVDLAAADVPVVRPVALKRGGYATEVIARRRGSRDSRV